MATRKPRAPKKAAQPQIVLTNEHRAKVLEGMPPGSDAKLDGILQNAFGSSLAVAGTFLGNGDGFGAGPAVAQPDILFQHLRNVLVSTYRQQLSQSYVEIGLVQSICDVPVDDALRGGVKIISKQLSEEEIEQIQRALDTNDDLNTLGYGGKWDRLFGGAGIIIVSDQDPSTPFDITSIDDTSLLEFTAVDRWELYGNIDGQDTNAFDKSLQQYDYEYFDYYGKRIHKSRVIQIKGKKAPAFIRGRLGGWGFSVVEALVRSLNQYLKGTSLTFEVLDEFKIDVYKVQDLASTLVNPGGFASVAKNLAWTNQNKNYQNAIVMDAKDEYLQKQVSFAGLAEAQMGVRMQVAADMRMPVCKLFGSQAGGLNPDDESDLEVYNAMVESEVRAKLKAPLRQMIELRCQQLFGYIPDDLKVEFHPLRMLKATDEEQIKTTKYNRAADALGRGALTIEEFRDNANKEGLFSVYLDKDDSLQLIEPGKAEIVDKQDGKEVIEAPEQLSLPKGQSSAQFVNAEIINAKQ